MEKATHPTSVGPAALKAESFVKTTRPARAVARTQAAFVESMECLGVATLPEGPNWTYEIKLDGFRLEAVKTAGRTTLYSRRGNVLNAKFQSIADALEDLPDKLLQSFRSAEASIHYYAFDILMLKGRSVADLPLKERRSILEQVLPTHHRVSLSVVVSRLADVLRFVNEHCLEGVVAKDADSRYEAGKRSGRWMRGRSSSLPHESERVSFPATRREIFSQIKHLKSAHCPFANLPDRSPGRFWQGLTAEKMRECVWLKPDAS